MEVKFNEVSLKLKQKTYQYDFLMKSQRTGRGDIETNSACTQTVKEEPTQIGVVNVASSSTAVTTGAKRVLQSKDEVQRTTVKRKKTSKSDANSRTTRQSTPKFTCAYCLVNWGFTIMDGHNENPDESGAPDPKQAISTFSNFENYKDHLSTAHRYRVDEFCKEKSCFSGKDYHFRPHGDIRCIICSLSFKVPGDHEEHMEIEHADLNAMSRKQIYELFSKYKT